MCGSVKYGGINGLVNNVFPSENGKYSLFSRKSQTSLIMLDFIFYKTCRRSNPANNSFRCNNLLQLSESLLMFESSKFNFDTCKYYYGRFSQYATQFLRSPTTIDIDNNLHKCYHRHLQDGIITDTVSGWLLYALFYYMTGEYNKTLRLSDYVLSRCKQGMVYLRC